jgi:hypothetical protein
MKKLRLSATYGCPRFLVNLLLAGFVFSYVFVSPVTWPNAQFFQTNRNLEQPLVDLPGSALRHYALTNVNGQRVRPDLNKQNRIKYSITDNSVPPRAFNAASPTVGAIAAATAKSSPYLSIHSPSLGGRAPPAFI